MTYEIIWSERALDQATGFLKDDPEGLDQLFQSVDLLADDPRPEGTAEYGTPDRRRMRSGRYRVLYDVNDKTVTVIVIHAGRTS
ncbi:type II toxin-antitoxin system RelE family toxin [Kribbella catacumbae]|uniref:type II toxin-antitoxin system RelE family toxin n=1 Tax=Kribbella catacumbae TaxID=460086 RepID=UPI000380031F|nr:type II toxin-antitoxin system RelE/ParE family toxin [Kribbella catacumbae]